MALGCAGCWATGARAEDSDAQQRATALFREGVAAGKVGDYAQAEIAFRTSYLLSESPSTLRNWALTEMKMGKMLEALGHLKVAVRASTWSPEQRAVVQQNLDDAYAATGHLAIQTSIGVRVAIDGELTPGAAPFEQPIDVRSGVRQIEARLGAETAHTQVDAIAGRVVEVNMAMALRGPDAPVARGTAALQPHSLDAPSESNRSTWWTPPHSAAIALVGVAVAGVGLGVGFEMAAQLRASDIDALRASLGGACTPASVAAGCSSLRDQIATVHQLDAVKDVGFAVGGAAAVGAAVILLVSEPAKNKAAARWTPEVGPGSVGVGGAF